MLYYLDTNIVVYAVQAGAPEHQRAVTHLGALELAGHHFLISELTRTETLVLPFQPGNGQLLQEFFQFLHGPNLRTVVLTAAMHARAAAIRGSHHYPATPPCSTEAVQSGGRPPSGRGHRMRLRPVPDQRQPVVQLPGHHGRGAAVIALPRSPVKPMMNLLTPPSPTKIREELLHTVLLDLLGPTGGADEELDERNVRDRYLVGMLAPKRQELSPEVRCRPR